MINSASLVKCNIDTVIKAAWNLKRNIIKARMNDLKNEAKLRLQQPSLLRKIKSYFGYSALNSEPTKKQLNDTMKKLWNSNNSWFMFYKCGYGKSLYTATTLLEAAKICEEEFMYLNAEDAALVSKWK